MGYKSFAFALIIVMSAHSVGRADLVGKYDANTVAGNDGDTVSVWGDTVGGYNLDPHNTPSLLTGGTPIGSAAIDFVAVDNDALAGVAAAPTGFPLANATALTAAVVFSPDNADVDNDPGNTNFWGHPQIASGDQGGGHPDWGFGWGPDTEGINKVWFGVGEDTGGNTPTATANGADPGDAWYVAVGTWDGSAGEIASYLFGQDGSLIDSSTLATPSATVGRVDVGFSTGGERPNIDGRSLDGQIAAINLYDNAVDAAGAAAIAGELAQTHLIPEPSSIALLICGIGTLLLSFRRRT